MGVGHIRLDCFSTKQIWKIQAPPRIALFAWEAGKECILTIDNLMRRERVMVKGCYLRKHGPASCNHILLCCSVTYNLWSMVYGLLGISWVMARSVKEKI